MRLEEWKRWLEKQFLDNIPPRTEGEGSPPEARQVVGEERPPAEAPARAVAERPASPVQRRGPATDVPAAVPTATAAPTPPSFSQTPTPGAPRPPERPVTGTGLPPVGDVPRIENYLPFLRATSPVADDRPSVSEPSSPSVLSAKPAPVSEPTALTPQAAPEPAPADTTTEPPATPAPQIEVAAEARMAQPRDGQPSSDETPASESLLQDADFQAPQTQPPVLQEAQPRSAPQRKRRARPARHVTPPELAAPLTSEEFWQLVPRHIRTLIAMGQDEGVQHSYRRKFKESRLAIIERLLDPTLSLEETARLLNVCPATVRRYTNRGQLRHFRTPGDQRRFKLSDVLAFMEAQSSADRGAARDR